MRGLSRKAFLIGDDEHPLTGVGGPGRNKQWHATEEFIAKFKKLALTKGLLAISKEEGMPSSGTLSKMLDESPAMRAAYEEARKERQPFERKLSSFEEYGSDITDEICQLIRGGQFISDICRREDMPCFATVQRWRKRHADVNTAITNAEYFRDNGEEKNEPDNATDDNNM